MFYYFLHLIVGGKWPRGWKYNKKYLNKMEVMKSNESDEI